jgi:hypothetical protein
MDERVRRLYAVAHLEPRYDDMCVVDTRCDRLVSGGAIYEASEAEYFVGVLNAKLGPVFKAVPTRDCGPYTQRASRVVRRR